MSTPSPAPLAARPELRSLTGLRFLAAFHVLVFHALFTFSRASLLMPPGTIRTLLSSGYVSVNLFFVLSGFVLAYAYGPDPSSLRAGRFWRARFARTYPLHLIGLALALPLFVLGSQTNQMAGTAIAREGAVQLGLSALLVQAWIPAHALDLNGPSWSLSVEAFFYLCFPFLLRLLAPLRTRGLAAVALAAWVAALVPPLVHAGPASVLAHATNADLVVLFDPLLRLPDFVIGAAAGLLFLQIRATQGQGEWKQAPMVSAATSLLLFALLAESDHLPFALLHDGLLDPLWALLVFALAMRGGDTRGIGSDPLVRGGHASYALYVLHKPLYFWAARLLGVGLLPSSGFLAAYLGGSVLVAVVVWSQVEEPLRAALLGEKRG